MHALIYKIGNTEVTTLAEARSIQRRTGSDVEVVYRTINENSPIDETLKRKRLAKYGFKE